MTVNPQAPWVQPAGLALPAAAQPSDIIQRAALLNPRDQSALVRAFEAGAYEVAVSFVWSKALAVLKKQLATLGMAFVGEMLGRTDLHEASSPVTDLREDEAIEAGEQLALISTPDAIRLRAGQTLVNHFLDPAVSPDEQMQREEAIALIRSCVGTLLAEPKSNGLQPVLDLRTKLETEALQADPDELERLATSPYFVLRTTLALLLADLKVATDAALEHAAGNIKVLLPVLWPRLRDRDRWQVGETFALVHSAGRTAEAPAALRQALLRVDGIAFSRDTLLAPTFRAAARAVLGAHVGWDSFAREPKALEALAGRWLAVPAPALADCFTAALCVRLGNRYGFSRAAQPTAERYLKHFRAPQWEWYLNRVLTGDRHVLEKLAYDDKPLERWQQLVADLDLADLTLDARVAKLVSADPAKRAQIKKAADGYRKRIMQEA